MKPHGLYNLSVDHVSSGQKPARVGLLRERTGIPLFVLYLESTGETSRRLEIRSADQARAEIARAAGATNRQAWTAVLSFFEAQGRMAHVVTHPLDPGGSLSERLDQMTGEERSFTRRTGIYSVKDFVECSDLIVIPQASTLLSGEFLTAFYRKLFDLVEKTDHFFVILDLPKGIGADTLTRDSLITSNAAVYYPWLIMEGAAVPPGPVAAAAFQRNDAEFHLNDLPANRPLPGHFIPLYHHEPAELRGLNQNRINVFHRFGGNELRIWGGRTLADRLDFDSRFISTRRTMVAVKEAVAEICEPFVLEPLHPDLPKFIDVALQSSFQPHRKTFDLNHANPFQTDVRLVESADEDVIEVGVKCYIPFAVDELSFHLAIR